jgi:hypothetical protein
LTCLRVARHLKAAPVAADCENRLHAAARSKGDLGLLRALAAHR